MDFLTTLFSDGVLAQLAQDWGQSLQAQIHTHIGLLDGTLGQAAPPTTPPAPTDLPASPPGTVKVENLSGTAARPGDFSIWALILRADIIVKAVLVMLVLGSIWSWAIIFEKIMLVRRINKRANQFEETFWSGGSIDDLHDRISKGRQHPMSATFSAAMEEWRRSNTGDKMIQGGVKDRIERAMQVTVSREMDRVEARTGFLATVGSTAPFVGLFGTVWGIMNSFQDIAIQKNATLVTVAPGISEALFATALGLVAAIPAVVAYNKLTGDYERFAHRLDGFTGDFSAIVSRQIDEKS